MLPVASPSPDYIPGPEEPQTPPAPQDEDEHEPMFIQPHDPDFVPEPIYPEYIPLEDEHILLAEEQPLPPVVSPTAESRGYVAESDPKEDPEEYEYDKTEDGLADYPMDGGDDGDEDDGDSSRYNAGDEDEEEQEEKHLALADSTVVIPTDELVSPPEGTEPIIPPPSIDTATTRAKITIRLQTSISFPPEAEVERLLAMPTPSPSPLTSLSPPSARERLARCTAPAALPSPPLLPSLYLPPPVDRRDDIPESEQPPRKKVCLSTLCSRHEVGESSTRGQGVDYGFADTVEAEMRHQDIREVGYGIRDTWIDPTEAVLEMAPTTLKEVNTRVTELAELHEHDTQDLYALLEDAQYAIMSHTSSTVTYTSVYIDSEPGRVFWGADKELSDRGPLRVIVYGYDGLPKLPVASPSPDYIPGPEEPHTPPAPQDEDENEPMFIQPHDLDFIPEPIYPEYITLEDEHILPAEEQPLPPVVSPTAESPGRGSKGEEKHLTLADSAVVIPTDELVSPPEGTEPIIPPPSIDTATTGAKITIRLQTSISFPPEAEVERLLAMPTPSPSPLTSLSPPSAAERLARCTAPAALPSPLLLPSLYLPPPVDRRDDIPESEQPPRKKVCLSTLGSRHEVGESSTRGRGVDYGFADTVEAEMRHQDIREVGCGIRDTWIDPAEAVLEMAPTTLEEVNTRVTELAELHEHDTQDLYALLKDAQDGKTRISQRVAIDSQRVDLLMKDRMTLQEIVWFMEEEVYAAQEAWTHSIGLSQTVHHELQTLHTADRDGKTPEADYMRQSQRVETLRVMKDMRREMGDMQAELLALRRQPRRAGQPGGDARVPNHHDAPRDANSHI
nr:hypothetical protein [Tanacetum cinerariifolium]